MNFIFPRNRTVASLSGHVIHFEKGVPTHVPPGMYQEVIAAGGVPEDDLGDDEKKVEVPQGEDRVALIRAAMEDMVAKNERGDFTAGGVPNIKKLSAILGFNVNNKERDTIWDAMRQE